MKHCMVWHGVPYSGMPVQDLFLTLYLHGFLIRAWLAAGAAGEAPQRRGGVRHGWRGLQLR